MKLNPIVLIAITTLSTITFNASASETQDQLQVNKDQGFRVELGRGVINLDYDYAGELRENGFALRGGYDFNKVVSLNATFSKYEIKGTDASDSDTDLTSLGVNAEFGYTFHNEAVSFKPFGTIGGKRGATRYTDYDGKREDSEVAVAFGIGGRVVIYDHVLLSATYEVARYDYLDAEETVLSIGYRF